MPSTIGQQLKKARLDRNLNHKDVFEKTHIRVKYLEALEADDFSMMPSPVQGRGFLRLYAQYLNLDIDAVLEELRSTESQETTSDFTKIKAPPSIEKNKADDEGAGIPPDEEETESLWVRFQNQVSKSLAKSKPAPAQETESLPSTEAPFQAQASPTPTSEPSPNPDPVEDIQFEPSQPPEESQVVFAKIGVTLRKRREMLSLTHEEIEAHLHLRPHYLVALEGGDFNALPSPVQTRGMLNNYADFLDLDTDILLIRFAEGLQAQRVERNLTEEQFASTPKKQRRFSLGSFIAPDLIFGVGMVALLIAFSVWGLGRIAKNRVETEVAATAPSIAEVLMTTPTMSIANTITPTVIVNTPAPNAETGTEIPIEEALPQGEFLGVKILVTIMERTWLRTSVDGEIIFEGRTQPDATFVYEGNETVEILTANGAGVRVAYNQVDMGLMGGFGEVVQRLYGARGILTPTITPTLPITATPSPTITPSPTRTPTTTQTAASE